MDDDDFVMSDGNASNMESINGPWVAEFSIEVKFDGFARMWCEDLQLGTAGDAAALCDLIQHIYARAEVLILMKERNTL